MQLSLVRRVPGPAFARRTALYEGTPTGLSIGSVRPFPSNSTLTRGRCPRETRDAGATQTRGTAPTSPRAAGREELSAEADDQVSRRQAYEH